MLDMTMKREGELTAGEKLRLGEFLAALDLFSDLEPNMPVSMLRVFVYVAMHEGYGSIKIAQDLGLQSGPASRYLGDWGPFDRYRKPSHSMIEGKATVEDRRARLQYLTHKGRAFLRRLLLNLRPEAK